MYNPKRLEWHLDENANLEPRKVLCGLVRQQARFLIRVNRLAVALAKSQDHRASCGVFAFGDIDRQGALANNLHGLNPKNTAPITPVGKRRTALVWRLLKSKVQRWNKALLISEQTRHTHLVYFFKYMETDGLDLGLSTLGEPMLKRNWI
jgi:hypothetical protein